MLDTEGNNRSDIRGISLYNVQRLQAGKHAAQIWPRLWSSWDREGSQNTGTCLCAGECAGTHTPTRRTHTESDGEFPVLLHAPLYSLCHFCTQIPQNHHPQLTVYPTDAKSISSIPVFGWNESKWFGKAARSVGRPGGLCPRRKLCAGLRGSAHTRQAPCTSCRPETCPWPLSHIVSCHTAFGSGDGRGMLHNIFKSPFPRSGGKQVESRTPEGQILWKAPQAILQ